MSWQTILTMIRKSCAQTIKPSRNSDKSVLGKLLTRPVGPYEDRLRFSGPCSLLLVLILLLLCILSSPRPHIFFVAEAREAEHVLRVENLHTLEETVHTPPAELEPRREVELGVQPQPSKAVDKDLAAIDELLKKNLISKCVTAPRVVSPLSVSIQSSGKKRLILDLSRVNKFVYKSSVKYEDWTTFLTYWNQEEARQSSTWRELKAVYMVLASLVSSLDRRKVKWFTDNQNIVSIVDKGSMKSHLQSIAVDIFDVCLKHNIDLSIQWLPRNGNLQADYLSRLVDYDDWGIASVVFGSIDKLWGPHHVDRFASYYNAKLEQFNSRYSNPGCAAVDAFTVTWRETMNAFHDAYQSDLSSLPDEVAELAAGLPDLLCQSRAQSTVSKYRYGYAAWKSLRSGGATAAANNGIPDRMFKRHGRWRSEKAKDGYVKDKLENRIKVSLSLGL
ncbi:uncharacterized protein LOC124276085 [Haliotis rubra]|uniref:uncharacterized protein LOC124276085 n=1 Tax=Haliotis rubra TaxID=36100 RepID=UPI001EE5DC66|nr:uncharacterized protein LOC124276085 [Haliotis rubra]